MYIERLSSIQSIHIIGKINTLCRVLFVERSIVQCTLFKGSTLKAPFLLFKKDKLQCVTTNTNLQHAYHI